MRVGVIGCGAMGRRRIAALRQLGLTGFGDILIHDANWERQFNAGISSDILAFHDVPSLLARQPDAVLICTPPDTHLEYAHQARDFGIRGIFCEKPLSLWLPDPAELATFDGLTTFVGCNWRFCDAGRETARQLVAGDLGEARVAALTLRYDLPSVRPDYRRTYAVQTGAVFDVAWHLVDLALEWFGPAELADSECWGADRIGYPDVDGAAYLELRHVTGVRSQLTASFLSADYEVSWQILGRKNWGRWFHYVPPDASMFAAELQHFLTCVRLGTETINPFSKAARVLKLCLEAKARWQTTVST